MRIGGFDIRDVTQRSLHDVVGVVTQDAHLFHDTIRANLTYARRGATEEELIEACQAAQIWDLVSTTCPTAWTPSWATADNGCPAARSSASPWPGCC